MFSRGSSLFFMTVDPETTKKPKRKGLPKNAGHGHQNCRNNMCEICSIFEWKYNYYQIMINIKVTSTR